MSANRTTNFHLTPKFLTDHINQVDRICIFPSEVHTISEHLQ